MGYLGAQMGYLGAQSVLLEAKMHQLHVQGCVCDQNCKKSTHWKKNCKSLESPEEYSVVF